MPEAISLRGTFDVWDLVSITLRARVALSFSYKSQMEDNSMNTNRSGVMLRGLGPVLVLALQVWRALLPQMGMVAVSPRSSGNSYC
jgi:hypothetical protein